MEITFINETAGNIVDILSSKMITCMSWGIQDLKACIFNEMASLKFSVNGFLHKGKVVVSYNQGADTFEIFLLEKSQLKDHIYEVYFDELVDKIDSVVETKNEKSKHYQEQIKEFLTSI